MFGRIGRIWVYKFPITQFQRYIYETSWKPSCQADDDPVRGKAETGWPPQPAQVILVSPTPD